MKKLYKGQRGSQSHCVTVTEGTTTKMLPMCLNIRNHSPTGFEWGYGGSGPAQLALAILVDLLGEKAATPLYQDFKFALIATLPRDDFELSEDEIRQWLEEKKAA